MQRLRATGMPIRQVRRYAELLNEGDGNEAERLQLLVEHREAVKRQLEEIARNLDLIEYKIDLYREKTSS